MSYRASVISKGEWQSNLTLQCKCQVRTHSIARIPFYICCRRAQKSKNKSRFARLAHSELTVLKSESSCCTSYVFHKSHLLIAALQFYMKNSLLDFVPRKYVCSKCVTWSEGTKHTAHTHCDVYCAVQLLNTYSVVLWYLHVCKKCFLSLAQSPAYLVLQWGSTGKGTVEEWDGQAVVTTAWLVF